jgi:hypothetical protein
MTPATCPPDRGYRSGWDVLAWFDRFGNQRVYLCGRFWFLKRPDGLRVDASWMVDSLANGWVSP